MFVMTGAYEFLAVATRDVADRRVFLSSRLLVLTGIPGASLHCRFRRFGNVSARPQEMSRCNLNSGRSIFELDTSF
jgi:hypothetical protein